MQRAIYIAAEYFTISFISIYSAGQWARKLCINVANQKDSESFILYVITPYIYSIQATQYVLSGIVGRTHNIFMPKSPRHRYKYLVQSPLDSSRLEINRIQFIET